MSFKITYPNYSNKAISFSIDDGNLKYDCPFLDILRPHGILGTFNLSPRRDEPSKIEGIAEIYQGYGIANHVAYHPRAFLDGVEYDISDDPFDPDTADPGKVYRSPKYDGIYLDKRPLGWRNIVPAVKYIECIKESREILEEVFEREINGFVWPFGYQNSAEITDYLYKNTSYVRRTGCTHSDGDFAPPESFYEWRCTANQTSLLEDAALFEACESEGLKLFTFGVHSVDYERYDGFESLTAFAERYGDRPRDFWYASIEDIFDYITATRRLDIGDGYIQNNSDSSIYLIIDDERVELPPSAMTGI